MILRDPIISIPHSGTRSLANHLGRKAFYHFHQVDINAGLEIEGVIHAPVRDPLDHAVSWVCFEGSLGGSVDFFNEFARMGEFSRSYDTVFHKMEDIPRTAGFGPRGYDPLRKAVKSRDLDFLKYELPQFFEWVESTAIRAFYDRFYPDRWYSES